MSSDSRAYLTYAEDFIRKALEAGRHYRYYRHNVWEYTGTVYRELPKGTLESEVLLWCGRTTGQSDPNKTDKIARNVKSLIRETPVSGTNTWSDGKPGTWLACTNGIVNLDAAIEADTATVPHHPAFFAESLIPYDYDPLAIAPLWYDCLADWQEGDADRIAFLQEYAGYLLTPDFSHQVALFLEGSGANGKSIFCEVLKEMLGGSANVSAVQLEHFSGEYRLGETLGKLANISTETNPGVKIPTATLKQVISGDAIQYNRKYMPPCTCEPTVRLIVAWNERPLITDASEGLWRRFRIVPFNRRYDEVARDEHLKEKLRTELPGILNWAIEGLRRLRARGKFTTSKSMLMATESFRAAVDPVRTYLNATYELNADASILKDGVYVDFVRWCNDFEYEPTDKATFFKRIYTLWPSVLTVQRRVGPSTIARVLTGLRRKPIVLETSSFDDTKTDDAAPVGAAYNPVGEAATGAG